jgi:hypothetical protein
MESGVSALRMVSPARAVRPDSKDCISRRACGIGRKPLEEGRVGESKVAPSPKGYGMKPGNGVVSESELDPGVDGPELYGHCMMSANMSVEGGLGGSE